MFRNPPTNLDRETQVGLLAISGPEEELMVLAVDVEQTRPSPSAPPWQPLGGLLTDAPELDDWGDDPVFAFQVTRSAISNAAPLGLGPRLYEFAMWVLSRGGYDPRRLEYVLQPDDALSPAAERIWEKFWQRGWAVGESRGVSAPAYEALYAYKGSPSTTEQLERAAMRGHEWASYSWWALADENEQWAAALEGVRRTYLEALERHPPR